MVISYELDFLQECKLLNVLSKHKGVIGRNMANIKDVFGSCKYFPEMLFSGKENVFICLVAFQKIFRKIFSDVWKRRRKRQTQEKYHQRSRSEIAISPARSRDQRRELATVRSTRRKIAISVEGEIAPSIVIFAAIVGLELARSAPPGARSPPAIVGLTRMFLLLSHAFAHSLSLSFSGNALK